MGRWLDYRLAVVMDDADHDLGCWSAVREGVP